MQETAEQVILIARKIAKAFNKVKRTIDSSKIEHIENTSRFIDNFEMLFCEHEGYMIPEFVNKLRLRLRTKQKELKQQ